MNKRMRHLLSLFELDAAKIQQIFESSRELKTQWRQGERKPLLARRVAALLFSKPSLRTRVSFEAGMAHLGGQSLYLGQDVGWQSREAAGDFGRVLSQYVDVIVCRTHEHALVEELASVAECPVINGLTSQYHPCQALADLFTLWELRGELKGAKLVFVGDGNNVARSLAIGCTKLGLQFTLASPPQYTFRPEFLEQLRGNAPQAQVEQVSDPRAAVEGAAAIYTDVWCSMGHEKEEKHRRQAFAPFQVNERLLGSAPDDAVFLHCLPARRGEEVTDGVIDGPQSRVILQAANRMHVQKGVLVDLLGEAKMAT